MDIKKITEALSVSSQINLTDIAAIADQGYKTLICNRPDNEGSDQTNFADIQALAKNHGMHCHYLPVVSGQVSEDDANSMNQLLSISEKPVLAYCRTGTRSIMLWALNETTKGTTPIERVKKTANNAGYDLDTFLYNFNIPKDVPSAKIFDVVVIGGGTSGIATSASLLKRNKNLNIAIIEPTDNHCYQAAWTLVGGGCYDVDKTKRYTRDLIPDQATWIHDRVESMYPDRSLLRCSNGELIKYQHMIVACGLVLDWDSIEGAKENLGKNGVTSNYSPETAPYTFECVKNLKSGIALFTQPPMPIKCAGAPQKAMYLSGDYWYRGNSIDNIDIEFFNAGEVLFGVDVYVPALMEYVKKYNVKLNFKHTLIKVDGKAKKAWFEIDDVNGEKRTVEKDFDMIHITPAQKTYDFISQSPLSDDQGWVDVDQYTLQHKAFDNVWAAGDVSNAPNAKTAAAARAQAPIVANNILHAMGHSSAPNLFYYDGYGSCPLTVEKGKVVLAEFGYGGELKPSFPKWLLNGTKATRKAWVLKKNILPNFYWNAVLKGREWLVNKSKAK